MHIFGGKKRDRKYKRSMIPYVTGSDGGAFSSKQRKEKSWRGDSNP
jgi:hypothetical protein